MCSGAATQPQTCASKHEYDTSLNAQLYNADELSRLPAGPDLSFDGEEGDNDVDTVCTIRTISLQLQPYSRNQLKDSANKDPVISEVKRYVREGWPQHIDRPEVQEFKKYSSSLSVVDDCLINGNRVVIPEAMRTQILDILHLGYFACMQKMKQLARSAVYWPHIDSQIEDTCRCCTACAEHQNRLPQPANHPWMMPEKPWSRIHIDHAINFMGSNWLIVTDAYSKYPCIHQTSSTSTKATTTLLEEDFAHFGYLHTIVSDNATTFRCAEFQECMVSLQRHQTSHWSSISSSHKRGSGETRTILQTIYEEVKAATQTSPTGIFDAVSPHATQHRLFTKPTPKWSSNTYKDRLFAPITGTHRPGTASYRCHKETAERTIYSSARSYQIQRWNTMLRSVLWPETYQLPKMGTSHCHQSAWYQVFHRESPSSRTFVETPLGTITSSIRHQ